MSTDIVEEKINIEDMIYEIRGKQVILDSDLASLYGVETRVLNQAIKRNSKRFPKEFMFKLEEHEWKAMSSHVVMTSRIKRPKKSLPYVFTEQGVAMTSSILKNEKAIRMSIKIINAFVSMRKFIKNNLLEQQYINTLVLEHDKDIKLLQETFDKLEEKGKNTIFFEGQMYDAHSLLLEY